MGDTLPVGTVTFLFTDIQGTTRLWEQHPDIMQDVLVRHDALVHQAIKRHGGIVFKTVGGSFCAAFSTALNAVNAALTAQLFLLTAPWPDTTPIKVRMALHAGEAEMRNKDYFGPTLNRAARLLFAGHGGQILLSRTAYALVHDFLPPEVTLRDLGEHHFKDLSRPEHAFQLVHPSLQDDFPPLRSLENPNLPNNLPQQTTSFVGREKELDAVRSLIQTNRLVTLTGSGGVGKTRLSLQVAADLLEEFPDGVWFVELAPLVNPEYVSQTVASILHVAEEPGQTPTQTLANALKEKHLLLVLDNCEHVLAACIPLVNALLQSCPQVRILASSRESLNIAGERTHRVPSLSLPAAKRKISAHSLTQYEAVRLFIDRALLARADFQVTNANAPAVASLCTRLDGIPLALELAAARIRLLTVEEINTRLTDTFQLLTAGNRAALPRQQTIRATIDWSYNLLTPQEQLFLGRLSVFTAGWTIEAAEAVCSGPAPDNTPGVEGWETLDLLTALADKSLVVADTDGPTVRYRLLETVRQYATEKLLESGEGDAVYARHRDWYVEFVRIMDKNLDNPDSAAALDRIDAEYDDIRAALAWSGLQAGGTAGESGAQECLLLVNDLIRFWERRGYHGEGRDTLVSVLALPGAERVTRARAAALISAGNMHYRTGNLELAHALYKESLPLQEELGNIRGKAAVLGSLGNVTMDQKDYTAARSYIEAALAINRETGNRRWESYNLMAMGNTLSYSGNREEAVPYLLESLTIAREVEDKYGQCLALQNLGSNYTALSDWEASQKATEEALSIAQEAGFQGKIAGLRFNLSVLAGEQGDISTALEGGRQALRDFLQQDNRAEALSAFESIARCHKRIGLYPEAIKWFAFAALQRIRQNLPISDRDGPIRDHEMLVMRYALGTVAFQIAQAEGEALTWEQAIALALHETPVSDG